MAKKKTNPIEKLKNTDKKELSEYKQSVLNNLSKIVKNIPIILRYKLEQAKSICEVDEAVLNNKTIRLALKKKIEKQIKKTQQH